LLASGVCDGQPPKVAATLQERNVFALLSIVNQTKDEQNLRQRLQDLPTIAEAEKAVAGTINKENQAAQSLEQLDVAGLKKETAKQVGVLAGKLKQFRTDREKAESALQLIHDFRDRLNTRAPMFLTRRVARICSAIPQSQDLGEAKNELRSLQKTLSPQNHSLSIQVKNGGLDSFISIYCPEAILPSDPAGYGLRLDQDKLYAGFARLRAEDVPAMRERIETLQATLDAATTEARLPIEKWIGDGEITTKMLLE